MTTFLEGLGCRLIIRHDFAIKIGCTFQPLASNQPKCVFVANGETLNLRHSVDLKLNIEGETFVCKAVVASGLSVSQDLILGLDFLRKYAAKVNFEDNTLTLGNEVLTNISVKSDKQDVLSLCDLTKIKKQTTAVVRVRIPSRFNNKLVEISTLRPLREGQIKVESSITRPYN